LNRSAGTTTADTSSRAVTVADLTCVFSAARSPMMSPWPRTARIFSLAPVSVAPFSAATLTLTQPESMIITWDETSPSLISTDPALKTSSTPAAASAVCSGSESSFQKLRRVGRSQRTLAALTSRTAPACWLVRLSPPFAADWLVAGPSDAEAACAVLLGPDASFATIRLSLERGSPVVLALRPRSRVQRPISKHPAQVRTPSARRPPGKPRNAQLAARAARKLTVCACAVSLLVTCTGDPGRVANSCYAGSVNSPEFNTAD
jgi:hypothetical protein